MIPSLPGYGFSGRPTGTGWGPDRIGQAWAELMKRLGTHAMSPRAATGAPHCQLDGTAGPQGLVGIHVNLPGAVPPEVAAVIPVGTCAGRTSPEGTRGVHASLLTPRWGTRPTSR